MEHCRDGNRPGAEEDPTRVPEGGRHGAKAPTDEPGGVSGMPDLVVWPRHSSAEMPEGCEAMGSGCRTTQPTRPIQCI